MRPGDLLHCGRLTAAAGAMLTPDAAIASRVSPGGWNFKNCRRLEGQLVPNDIARFLPAGAEMAFVSDPDCNDVPSIWNVRDRVHTEHGAMVLLHGGLLKGAAFITAKWADAGKALQVCFKQVPIWLVMVPGLRIIGNLAGMAKEMGMPVCRSGGRHLSALPPDSKSRLMWILKMLVEIVMPRLSRAFTPTAWCLILKKPENSMGDRGCPRQARA